MPLLVLLLSLFLTNVKAASLMSATGNSSGTVNVALDWAGGVAPVNGDTITVKSGTLMRMPNGYSLSIGSLTLQSGTLSSYTTWYMDRGAVINVSSNISMGDGSSGYAAIVALGSATFNMTGSSLILDTRGNAFNFLNLWGDNWTSSVAWNWGLGGTGGCGTQKGGGQGGTNFLHSSFTYVWYANMCSMGTGGTLAGAGASNNADMMITSFTMTNSGQFIMSSAGTNPGRNRYMEFSDIRDPTSTTPLLINAANANAPTVRNDVIYTTFSSNTVGGTTNGMTVQVNGTSVSFRNNVFKNFQITHSGANALDTYLDKNIFFSSNSVTSCQPGGTWAGSTTVNNNFFYASCDNPHFWQGSSGVNQTRNFTNNIIETDITGSFTDDGDILAGSPSATSSSDVVKNNIGIGYRGTSVMLSYLGGTNLASSGTMTNNTVFFSTQVTNSHSCFSIGETFTGKQNEYPYLACNLCVASSSDTAAHILRDLNAATSSNKISTATLNAYWYIAGAPYQGVQNNPTAYGVGDILINPNLINPWAELHSWDTSIGGDGTREDFINGFLKINGNGGAWNPAYSFDKLMAYIRTGYTPTAQALQKACSNGTDIGAVPVAPPTAFFRAGPK